MTPDHLSRRQYQPANANTNDDNEHCNENKQNFIYVGEDAQVLNEVARIIDGDDDEKLNV